MFGSYQRLTYDSNTVIIQVCVAGMPSDIQAGFQSSVAKRLATLLASTDVTLTSVFTDTHNNLCMYYAHQVRSACRFAPLSQLSAICRPTTPPRPSAPPCYWAQGA